MPTIPSATARQLAAQAQRGHRHSLGDLLRAIIDGTVSIVGGAFDAITLGGTLVTATGAEINRVADTSSRIVNVTAATLAVAELDHDSKVVTLNRAAGITATLPAATGSGAKLQFIIGTTITSNSTIIKVANSSDVMTGNAIQAADGGSTLNMWEAGAADDTITLNGSTTGGVKGDSVELIDIAANTWWVRVVGAATGTEATPFSATV